MPGDFVTRYLKKYEADLIWRVRYGPGEGEWFFVFVLVELQSTVQRFMALRLLIYVLQLCAALLEHGKYLAAHLPCRLLPPVLSVMLYNGEKPWTAPLTLAELFKPMEGFTPPDFQYVVLDVNRYSPEELRPVESVTSGVFLMEQASDVEELRTTVAELDEIVDDADLAYDLTLLLNDVATKLKLSDEEIPRLRSLEEVKMSLLQRVEKWPKQWMAEGRAEGLAKGLAKGKAKGLAKGKAKGRRLGKAETLKTLVHHRWGEVPDWAVDRIDRADVDTLDAWTCRVLDVTDLEDVFRDAEPAAR